MDAVEAFAVLDLKPGASAAEIEAAYKAAVKAWHPDRFNHSPDMRDVAEAKLRRLNEAYELLTQAVPEGGQPSAPDDEAEYVDEQIVYVGHDPRLPPISGPYSKGRPGIVSVCSAGVALLVADDPNDPAPMQYPVESLQCFSRNGRTWLAEGIKPLDVDLSGQKPEQCSLIVNDPNGIKKYIRFELRFRNDYHAELFVRRAFALMRLPVAKAPEPQPIVSILHQPLHANEIAGCMLVFLLILATVVALVLLAV